MQGVLYCFVFKFPPAMTTNKLKELTTWLKRVLFISAIGLFSLSLLGKININHPFYKKTLCYESTAKEVGGILIGKDVVCDGSLSFIQSQFLLFLLFLIIGILAWSFYDNRTSRS
jgi:hypothetical protein